MEMTFVPLALLGAAILLLVIFFYYVPFLLWISAKVSGVNISLIQLFLMRIRNVPPYVITRAMIEAHKAGLKTLTRDELEAHYLAGGHVEKVVHALVSASKANIDLPSRWQPLSTWQDVMYLKPCKCRSTRKSSTHLPLQPLPKTVSS